ncbi:hypothetical protein [Clostridium thailandense]|uniref:hypothetical protein n=1 Tax=Clostridium thailandense TaxID=2794346 RepID=UPI003988F1A9
MKKSYFMKIYKKRWKYRLIAMAFLMIISISMLYIARTTYNDYKNNPFIINNDEDYASAVENDRYVQISTDKLYDLNLVMTEVRSRGSIQISKDIKSNFIAVKIGERILPIAIPVNLYNEIIGQNKKTYVFKGKLVGFNENHDLELFKDSLIKSGIYAEEVNSLAYTNYLDYNSPFEYVKEYVDEALLILLVIVVLMVPIAHKNIKALKRLKNYSQGDLEAACQKIDEEIELPDVYKKGPITITKSYIIVESQQIVFAMPIKELVGVYKQQLKRFILKRRNVNSIVFVFSDKSIYKIDIYKGEEKIDSIIKYISSNDNSCSVGLCEGFGN